MQEKTNGLSVFHLKIIAYTTMLIDHIGAFVLDPYIAANLETMGYQRMRILDFAYEASRSIGRIAFPLFCFMLVEGLFHTKNRWRYLARLLIFAVLSDIPFDLAYTGEWHSYQHQSVMITLSIAFLVLIAMEEIRKLRLPQFAVNLLQFVPVAAGCVIAYFVKCDYGFKGILVISALYLLYPLLTIDRGAYALAGGALFMWEWVSKISRVFGSLSFITLLFYNGQKGKSAKWFFYFFYPVHLLILYFIRRALLGA